MIMVSHANHGLKAYVALASPRLFAQKATALQADDVFSIPYPESRTLDLGVNEQIIVDDIVDYYRDLIRLGEDSAAMKNPAHSALDRFSTILTRQINLSHLSAQSGSLNADVHLPATSLFAILDFVADELPHWRDRPDRPQEQLETVLTSQLCAHLNSVARHSEGWDILQFKTELPDEQHKGRKIDLAPTPCDAALCIEGRS